MDNTGPAPNTLEVGFNLKGEVIINHPDLQPDENGVGHIIFSPPQALNLADLLCKNAASVVGYTDGEVKPYDESPERSRVAVRMINTASGRYFGNPNAGWFYALDRCVQLEALLDRCMGCDTLDRDHVLGETLVEDIRKALLDQ